jgi:hypothetical protein
MQNGFETRFTLHFEVQKWNFSISAKFLLRSCFYKQRVFPTEITEKAQRSQRFFKTL